MREETKRSEMLLGEEGAKRLSSAFVAVFGVGGVGGYVCEALARAGVGRIELIDSDLVSLSNINRQIIALHSTVGRYKTEVMAERIRDIAPFCDVTERRVFFSEENKEEFDFSSYSYVVDAIDTVKSKTALIVAATEAGVPIISSMGAGNKLHPEMFRIADIYKTSVCPLAKIMRRELKAAGVKKLKTVYSEELPIKPYFAEEENGRVPAGSLSFVPSAAGLIIAGEVVRDIAFGEK